ncbi:MAG: ribosome maturation factor RimP [Acidobacteria bacterium]|nr:ribosome maturation factor RimP [Acidobacteriota bacterium]
MKASDSARRRSLEARITEMAENIAASMGMEVVLVEVKGGGNKSVVRAFIDQPEGVSLDDCERFSRRFSVSLDVEDWIPSSYTLEVSSPGVDRPLVKESDFKRFCGKDATVRTRTPIGARRNFKGRIADVAGGCMELEISQGNKVKIAIMDIEKAHLIGDLNIRPQGS